MNAETIGDNGLLLFFGIDRFGHEIKEMIAPPNPITEFYYQCTKYFDIDRFETLFTTKPIGHIIFISGQECIIYQFNGNWKKLKTLNANLIKRHHKGGQSSVRFSRLAEESRTQYITHIVDWINHLIVNDQNNYVFGGRELKDMLITCPQLKITLKTEDRFHIFNDRTIHDDYFTQLMTNPIFNNNKKVDNIIELLTRDPDYLLFSLDEIMEHLANVEYIVDIHHNIDPFEPYAIFKNKDIITLPIDHPSYARLQDYQIIGKLYVKIR